MDKEKIGFRKYMEFKDFLDCETVAETSDTVTILFKKMKSDIKKFASGEENE